LLSKNIKIKTYRTIVLLVVLYGCENWSLTIRGEQRLWVLDNRVLRKISGPKRGKGNTGVHNEQLYNLYSSYTIIWVIKSRRMKWVKHVAFSGMGEVHTGL